MHCLRTICLLSVAFFAAGCMTDGIHSEYGKRRGKATGRSVNGTGVLARIFTGRGYRVRSTSRLGRMAERADVIVWFPDRYRPPGEGSREFLESWLYDSPDRTLVIVGRDYDASVEYWQKSLEMVPAEDKLETRRRSARRQTGFARERSGFPSQENCNWYKIDREAAPRKVKSLEGPWSEGIDATAMDMMLGARIKPSDAENSTEDWEGGESDFQSLLTSEDDTIVGRYSREYWSGSQIIVVANGSWLLNLPLLNHEHRKLATRLVDECGTGLDNAVFLESGPGEPTLASNEPNRHHGLEAFTVWPVNCILIHLCLLGTILCFCVFPIFGRPRELAGEKRSNFGKHIEALGQLMYRTADRDYAKQRRAYYLQRVAKDTVQLESEANAELPAGPTVPQEAASTKTDPTT